MMVPRRVKQSPPMAGAGEESDESDEEREQVFRFPTFSSEARRSRMDFDLDNTILPTGAGKTRNKQSPLSEMLTGSQRSKLTGLAGAARGEETSISKEKSDQVFRFPTFSSEARRSQMDFDLDSTIQPTGAGGASMLNQPEQVDTSIVDQTTGEPSASIDQQIGNLDSEARIGGRFRVEIPKAKETLSLSLEQRNGQSPQSKVPRESQGRKSTRLAGVTKQAVDSDQDFRFPTLLSGARRRGVDFEDTFQQLAGGTSVVKQIGEPRAFNHLQRASGSDSEPEEHQAWKIQVKEVLSPEKRSAGRASVELLNRRDRSSLLPHLRLDNMGSVASTRCLESDFTPVTMTDNSYQVLDMPMSCVGPKEGAVSAVESETTFDPKPFSGESLARYQSGTEAIPALVMLNTVVDRGKLNEEINAQPSAGEHAKLTSILFLNDCSGNSGTGKCSPKSGKIGNCKKNSGSPDGGPNYSKHSGSTGCEDICMKMSGNSDRGKTCQSTQNNTDKEKVNAPIKNQTKQFNNRKSTFVMASKRPQEAPKTGDQGLCRSVSQALRRPPSINQREEKLKKRGSFRNVVWEQDILDYDWADKVATCQDPDVLVMSGDAWIWGPEAPLIRRERQPPQKKPGTPPGLGQPSATPGQPSETTRKQSRSPSTSMRPEQKVMETPTGSCGRTGDNGARQRPLSVTPEGFTLLSAVAGAVARLEYEHALRLDVVRLEILICDWLEGFNWRTSAQEHMIRPYGTLDWFAKTNEPWRVYGRAKAPIFWDVLEEFNPFKDWEYVLSKQSMNHRRWTVDRYVMETHFPRRCEELLKMSLVPSPANEMLAMVNPEACREWFEDEAKKGEFFPPLCMRCKASDHLVNNCTQTVDCKYIHCEEPEGHDIAVCPTLHGLGQQDSQRGHAVKDRPRVRAMPYMELYHMREQQEKDHLRPEPG